MWQEQKTLSDELQYKWKRAEMQQRWKRAIWYVTTAKNLLLADMWQQQNTLSADMQYKRKTL